jgi:hypothetical protein
VAAAQTVNHIEAACYYAINLIPWIPEQATKGLSITDWRKEQSVRTRLGLANTMRSEGTSLDSAGQKERVSTEEIHVAEFART